MSEELERDLFDEMLKKSSDNIVASPKKNWSKESEEIKETEKQSTETTQPENTEK